MSDTSVPERPLDHPLSPEAAFTGLQDFDLNPSQNTSKVDVESMNQADLLALHAKIEGKLTGITLSDVNLAKQALIQLKQAQILQIDATEDKKNVPMNQRAQVQNSIAGIIDKLAKIQMELYDSEYLKRLKGAVIKVVKTLPKPQQIQFFELLDLEAERIQAEMEA